MSRYTSPDISNQLQLAGLSQDGEMFWSPSVITPEGTVRIFRLDEILEELHARGIGVELHSDSIHSTCFDKESGWYGKAESAVEAAALVLLQAIGGEK